MLIDKEVFGWFISYKIVFVLSASRVQSIQTNFFIKSAYRNKFGNACNYSCCLILYFLISSFS